MRFADARSSPPAPGWEIEGWLNTDAPLTLESLRGRVVLLHAFQMLCPGCVRNGIPQASSAFDHFGPAGLAVIGLHTVFEHHDVMHRGALEAFAHEYRLRFPICIDRPAQDGPVPATMRAYRLRGTPSLALVDRCGRIRARHFGTVEDMLLGAMIGELLAEGTAAHVTAQPIASGAASEPACTGESCAVDASSR